jgi:UDP-N-acetylglucosamine 2-epimerase (non-hydrolysing)
MIHHDEALRSGLAERFAFLRPGSPLLLVVNQAPCDADPGPIDRAVRQLASQRRDLDIVYPADMVPIEAETAVHMPLEPANLHRVEPLDYAAFAYLLDATYLVLTNSEEIRGEAAILDKPAIVVRDAGHRASPDAAPWSVGDESQIVECVTTLLTDDHAYAAMRETAGGAAGDDMRACPQFVDALANLTQRAASLAA